MTLSITIAGVDVTSRVDVVNHSTGIESAADGTYAESTLILDDIDGSLTIEQWSEVIITESACAQPRLYTGYVTAAKATREDFTTGAGRVWTLAVADLNVLIGNQSRVFHASDANRPLESFNTRMAWLLASPQMTRVHDNGFVTSSTATYGESDYRKEYPDSVLQDLAVTSNRNRVYFVYWDPVAAQASLFIDNPAVALHTSTLALSNVRADIDNTTTFAPHQDAELDQDGSEMVDGALLTWKAGQTYYSNHDGRFPASYHRDASIETDRIGQATTAYNHAANYVAAHAAPIDTITCRVRIPRSQVTLIEAGMRIAVRFSHFPGYTTSTYIRVAHRTVDLKLAPNNQYDVDLILNERGVTAPGGDSGGFPQQSTCAPGMGDLVQSNTATGFVNNITVALASPATDGNLLVMGVSLRSANFAADPSGWTALPEGEVDPFENDSKLYYRTAVAGDQTWSLVPNSGGLGDASAVIAEFAAGVSYVASAELVSTDPYTGPSAPGASVTPTSGSVSTIVGFWGYKSDRVTGPTAGTGWTLTGTVKGGTLTRCAMAHKVVSAASGSYTPTIVAPDSQVVYDNHSYGEQSVAFSCTSAATPPRPGQWTLWTVVTLSGATGTTAFPYASGSLEIKVDGLLISTASYTETDNTTGAFTLSWTPNTDEVVTVRYQGI